LIILSIEQETSKELIIIVAALQGRWKVLSSRPSYLDFELTGLATVRRILISAAPANRQVLIENERLVIIYMNKNNVILGVALAVLVAVVGAFVLLGQSGSTTDTPVEAAPAVATDTAASAQPEQATADSNVVNGNDTAIVTTPVQGPTNTDSQTENR
jgi:hypothetical protein